MKLSYNKNNRADTSLSTDVYRPCSWLDRDEKLALLSFVSKEYLLDRFTSVDGASCDLFFEFMEQQAVLDNIKADLIHFISRDSDSPNLCAIEKLPALLSNKGVVCFDGSNAASLLSCLAGKLEAILTADNFAVLARGDGERAASCMAAQLDLFRRKYFFEKKRALRRAIAPKPPSVAIVVLTFNHENYIAACLESIFRQRGSFLARLIVVDDASSDRTAQIAEAVLAEQHHEQFTVEFHVNDRNVGVVKNLSEALRLAIGSDFLTFCEGDDYWSVDTRIQEHLEFLTNRPDCVMSFNTIEFCSAEGGSRRIYDAHAAQSKDVLTGVELAEFNVIGNFSACFYDGAILSVIPSQLFDMYTVDWMFNLYCSQLGEIGHLHKPMTVYRQHAGGEWSNREEIDKAMILNGLCDDYNRFLMYKYSDGLQKYKKILLNSMLSRNSADVKQYDLIILDDVFPAPSSGFRYAEFTAYLKEFSSSLALVSGKSLHVLGEPSLGTIINRYQLRYPEIGVKVMEGVGNDDIDTLKSGKLLYVNFLANAYAIVTLAEEAGVPFAFTLYPGGGFGLKNQESDRRLKRIFASPCFRKVIVTQRITYDYLVDYDLCEADKIEFIFGVVMPQNAFIRPASENRPRWGYGKKQLDICFMAHRYTQHGEDKGYDVFINAASRLSKLHADIHYHVVGPYDRHVLNVNHINEKITFYGTVSQDKLDDLFRCMDIVISPNISGKIYNGSFDGFPTASCTEGGLRGVAIFCTDEFNLSPGFFTDKHDIVLLKYDLDEIVDKLSWYYHHPESLREIGENGKETIKKLYSCDAQITPRVNVLRRLIETPFVFDVKKSEILPPCVINERENPLGSVSASKASAFWRLMRTYTPPAIKSIYRKHIKKKYN